MVEFILHFFYVQMVIHYLVITCVIELWGMELWGMEMLAKDNYLLLALNVSSSALVIFVSRL